VILKSKDTLCVFFLFYTYIFLSLKRILLKIQAF